MPMESSALICRLVWCLAVSSLSRKDAVGMCRKKTRIDATNRQMLHDVAAFFFYHVG